MSLPQPKKLTGGSLTPAYGRDYKSKAEAEADFRAGKDFVYHGVGGVGSGYCSIADFEKGATVQIRYASMRKVTVVKV